MTVDAVELIALLRDLESDRVERKASDFDREKIAEAICAFANDLPNHRRTGVVIIGANDDGSSANLVVTDQLLQRVADLRANGNIHPFPSMTVEKLTIEGREFVVVEIRPSENPPVQFRGRTYIRVGPRRGIATREEERRLAEKRRAGDLPFDARPVREASLNDLDQDLFERTYLPAAVPADILEANSRSFAGKLSSLRMATPDGTPTVLGILTLGRDPRVFLPGAYIQFVRCVGTELTGAIRAQRVLSGPLPESLRLIDEVLEANVSIASNLTSGATEVRHPDYPIVALRQIVWNAVLHRSYESTNAPVRISWFDDRIEVLSPGGPFGQVTVENFGRPGVTDYRNPNLAEAMNVLGYVQRFGFGIPEAQRQLERNGNPPLEFVRDPSYILAVLRRRR